MSEIPKFWLLALTSQMPTYLTFILVSKSIHPVNMVFSLQNAQYFHLSAPLSKYGKAWSFVHALLSPESRYAGYFCVSNQSKSFR
jgi:hypothetical protein